jgi:X-Pro dipeptidyl-peptidase
MFGVSGVWRSGRVRRALSMAVGAAALTLAAPLVASPAHAAPTPTASHIRGTQTVPIYSYENAIRESVSVETPLDSDADGVRDRVVVDLVRPREAAAAGVKVPVIMEASPYYQCCGRGNESEVKQYGADGTVTSMPLFYDNYFVPRGYAFAAVDLTGTSRSLGCADVGGPAEVLGAKAVIDWLNGRARGFNLDGTPARANWTTGKVGMIGKSWDGSIANGVAATGVQGLTTIVPIAGISSWYDYTRFNGTLRFGGYVDFLAGFVNGRGSACDDVIAAEQAASDDATGNLNDFWMARNYRPSVNKVRASVFVVHGLNDLNVTTNQFATWWSLLAQRGVPRHIWLAQQGHVDPFDFRRAEWVTELHRWFDFWLMGLRNGIMAEPQAQVERADGTWVRQLRWPALGAVQQSIFLGNGDGGTGTLTNRPGRGTRTIVDDFNQTEAQAVAAPNTVRTSRSVFLSGALARPLRLSGSPSVTLRLKLDKPNSQLSVRLVDYGTQHRVDYESAGSGISTLDSESCWGASTATDDACYLDTAEDFITSDTEVLTRGWQDAAHHRSLTRLTPLTPGTWYTITVPVAAYDATIAAGHVLGLVVTLSDNEFVSPEPTAATATIDLSRSRLNVPAVGPAILPSVTAAPTVPTSTATTGATPKAGTHSRLDRRQPEFR